MKRWVCCLLASLFLLSACADTTGEIAAVITEAAYFEEILPEERMNLKLGVSAGPYGDMFMEAVYPALAAKGYAVELVLYDDFIKPNLALANKEVDANMFQHTTYLNNFKLEYDLDLSAVAEIPTVSMGIFSARYRSLDDIENGAVVAIPDDATNLARALRVLEASGLIILDSQTDKSRATEADISRNPKELVFSQIAAPQLADALPDSGLAVINGNYAFAGGLDIAGALYSEALQEGYVNIIAVRTEDLPRQFVKDIMDVLHSDDFRDFVTAPGGKYSGFQRPLYLLR